MKSHIFGTRKETFLNQEKLKKWAMKMNPCPHLFKTASKLSYCCESTPNSIKIANP